MGGVGLFAFETLRQGDDIGIEHEGVHLEEEAAGLGAAGGDIGGENLQELLPLAGREGEPADNVFAGFLGGIGHSGLSCSG